MPRVWIVPEEHRLTMSLTEHPDGLAVDMTNSLYRQILAANKRYEKFQDLLGDFYDEAAGYPDYVRRVR